MKDQKDKFHKKRLEALGIYAGSIAHDLNNILTGILGHVSYLNIQGSSQEQSKESLKAIEDGARRAATLTQQILDYAKGEDEEREVFELSNLVQSVLNFMQPSFLKIVDFNIIASDRELNISGSESQINQVISNLFLNAYEALDDGGKIEIELSQVLIDSDSALDNFKVSAGNYASFVVRDNGLGISNEDLSHIFEPFFTRKKKTGTGLGLATVYSIVKSHSGVIKVDSALGQGTQFQVLLPLTDCHSRTAKNVSEEKIPKGSEKILVVDDEETVRTIIQRSLEHLGYTVEVAEDGIAALERFNKNPGEFGLVILDMIMPKMAGDEVFSKLREANQQIPVLISSGYSSDKKANNILNSGGSGFIQKPFAVDELAREVRRCLDCS